VIGSSITGVNTEDLWSQGPSYGEPVLYLFKLGPSGDTAWFFFHYVPITSTAKSHGYNVAVDNNCNVYLTGVIEGSFDMYPYWGNSYMLNGNGLFIEKLMCNSTGIDEVNDKNVFVSVYPNPSSGVFYIHSPSTIQQLQVTDMLGRVVYNSLPAKQDWELLLSVCPGMYQVIISGDAGKVVRKIMVQ